MIKPARLNAFVSVFLASGFLNACAISEASIPGSELNSGATFEQEVVPIDWERANADAQSNTDPDSNTRLQSKPLAPMAVPLLLPPESIVLSDSNPTTQTLAPPQMVSDKRGYSAVIESESFTILIDASNQTFISGQQSTNTLPNNFDGEYQAIGNGGQISIGRYGALYAVQLLCKHSSTVNCITERMVREVIESLSITPTVQQ